MIEDFKEQLRGAIDADNVVLIGQSLEFYKLLLEGLEQFSKAQDDPGYNLESARQEYRNAFGMDSVSQQLISIADTMNDEFTHALRDSKQDTTRELIRFIYRDILAVSRSLDVMSVARADQNFTYAISSLIYGEQRDIPNTPFHDKIADDLLFRLKEHTGLLLYYLKDKSETDTNKAVVKDWLEQRIGDLRGFLLGSYSKSKAVMFKKFLAILKDLEDERRFDPSEKDNLITLSRCNIFVVAAYVEGRSNESEAQKECQVQLDGLISKWTPDELTQTLVECIDKDYADKWRVDVYDLPADGQVYSVPNYGDKLREVWMNYMLKQAVIPQDVNAYRDIPLATTTTFSQGMSSEDDAYLIKRLNDLPEDDSVKNLRKLVHSFISLRREWEEDKLRDARLSTKKIKEFREAVISGYKERAVAYRIFQKAKKLKLVDKGEPQYRALGWNEVKEKAAFIEDWHIGFYMPGDQYGMEIARAQDQQIMQSLFKDAEETNIKELLSTIRKSGKRWLLFSRNGGSWLIYNKFDVYLKKTDNYHEIYFKNIKQVGPVEFYYDKGEDKGLYAVCVDDIGTLKVEPHNGEPIEVSVSAYSHNKTLLTKTLDTPPQWLAQKGSRDEQEKFLKTLVRMFINHVYLYQPKKNVKSYYVRLEEDY